MKAIRDLAGYPMSRDYAALAQLMQKYGVVCVADYCGYKNVCQTVYDPNAVFGKFKVTAPGVSAIFADTEEDFMEQCEYVYLEFIYPTHLKV